MAGALSDRQRVRQLIQDAGVSMLLTIDDRGAHSGRPMLPLLLDNDPHIYFLTHQSSRKVTQITVQPQIALTVVTAHYFIVVVGQGLILRDPELISQLWHPTYRAWFPDGKDDREAAVLRVSSNGWTTGNPRTAVSSAWSRPSKPSLRVEPLKRR